MCRFVSQSNQQAEHQLTKSAMICNYQLRRPRMIKNFLFKFSFRQNRGVRKIRSKQTQWRSKIFLRVCLYLAYNNGGSFRSQTDDNIVDFGMFDGQLWAKYNIHFPCVADFNTRRIPRKQVTYERSNNLHFGILSSDNSIQRGVWDNQINSTIYSRYSFKSVARNSFVRDETVNPPATMHTCAHVLRSSILC